MDNEPNAEKKARRHAVLMRGVVTPILGLLAVAAIGLGIMNATEWKPSRTITAQTQVSGSRYVVTDPGVAGLVDSDVREGAVWRIGEGLRCRRLRQGCRRMVVR